MQNSTEINEDTKTVTGYEDEAIEDDYDDDEDEMERYIVTVSRTGFIAVKAASYEDAMYIADHQTTDTVNWSDDWEPTDAEEVEKGDYDENIFVTEAAY